MKTARLAACAVLVLAACSESPTDSAQIKPNFSNNGAQQSVTGHVERDLSNYGVTIEKYSFAAVRTPNGTVQGRFEVQDRNANGTTDKISGRVTCFTILPDGQTALLGGVIESSTVNFPSPTPREALWTVRDNGEGDVDDVATDLSWGYYPGGAQAHCDGWPGFTTPPNFSMRGNVQVRP